MSMNKDALKLEPFLNMYIKIRDIKLNAMEVENIPHGIVLHVKCLR